MAAARGIPLVLQEQNSFPGISTRKLAPHARRLYLGFAKAEEYLRTKGQVTITGNPVRPTIAQGDRQAALATFKLNPSKKTILVLGGSQELARSIRPCCAHWPCFRPTPRCNSYGRQGKGITRR